MTLKQKRHFHFIRGLDITSNTKQFHVMSGTAVDHCLGSVESSLQCSHFQITVLNNFTVHF